jgi:hypothetical protein
MRTRRRLSVTSSPQRACIIVGLEDATMPKSAPVFAAVLALTLLAAGAARADGAPPPAAPAEGDAFALMPANGEHLRIDRRTGDVSLCAERSGVWSCQLLADDRARYEARIADLERQLSGLRADVDALRRDKADLEARLAPPPAPPPPAASADAEEEHRFERFLGYTDRMFRHFFDLVDELRDREDRPI